MTRPAARLDARRLISTTALLGAALFAGLLYPLTAFLFHPLALPAMVALAALGVVSLARPEVGIAVALVVTSLSEGIGGPRPWILGAVWTGLLVGITILRLIHDGWDSARLPPLCIVAFAVVVVDVVGLVLSGDPATATPYVRSTATGVALLALIATQVRTMEQLRWVLGGAVVSAALVGIHATVQYLWGSDASVGFYTSSGELVERVTGGFGHPNQLAGFLLLLVPIVIMTAALSRQGRALAVVAAGLAVVGVYASFSRAALMGLLAVPLILLRGRRLLLLTPVLALALVLAMPDLLKERFATVTTRGTEAATRLDFWHTATALFADNPVNGVGVGQFPRAYAEARVPGKRFLPTTIFEPPPHAHNLAFHLLAEQGLVGLTAFAGAVVIAVRHAVRLRRSSARHLSWVGSAVLTAIVAFLIHNVFDVTLFEATAIHFWAILGILSAAVMMARRDEGEAAGVAEPAVAARG